MNRFDLVASLFIGENVIIAGDFNLNFLIDKSHAAIVNNFTIMMESIMNAQPIRTRQKCQDAWTTSMSELLKLQTSADEI